jgi:Cu(I)/Ag(I) efflux system membrane fusion protein
MRLEPVYADSQAGAAKAALPEGAVKITAAHQQLIGVQTGEVTREPSSYRLRLPGRVTVDETRLHRLIAVADGWIRSLGNKTAGAFVRKEEVLASYYTPNFLGAQQSYLYGLRTAQPLQRAEVVMATQIPPTTLSLQTATDALRSLGMSDVQMEELQRTHAYASDIKIYSPIDGYVIARNVSADQRFEKGAELYRIADIGRVWVMADMFEKDREFAKPGATAVVRYQGREFHARMSEVLPQLDPQSRTLKTRFELENTGRILLPDVFVDVELNVNMPAAITAPADALIDSGRRKTVFVDRGEGIFEPRQVETGWRLGGRVEITKGLDPGERIAISGNFLIDSESRMRLVAANAAPSANQAPVKDPVCGMDVNPNAPDAIGAKHAGKTYYFCSQGCKKSFEANPGKYLPGQKPSAHSGLADGHAPGEHMKPEAAAGVSRAKQTAVKDPVCGMDVDPNARDAIGTKHGGKTYYFCSQNCKKDFEGNPGKYLPGNKPSANPGPTGGHAPGEHMKQAAVKDPICGMDVDPNAPDAISTKHGGKTYYFCSQNCRKAFEANPAKYVPGKEPSASFGPNQRDAAHESGEERGAE